MGIKGLWWFLLVLLILQPLSYGLMNNVLHPYLDKFFIFFVDDILVYSKNEEEYVEHLEVVLRLLRLN